MGDKGEVCMKQLPDKRKKIFFNDDDMVTRANAYINAKSSSSLVENKIFALATKKAEFDETGRLSVSISASELRSLMEVSGNGFYDTLKTAAIAMKNRALFFERKDRQEFAFVNILTSAVFKGGTFTINFNPEITPLLRNLRKEYTSMKLSYLFSFKSIYSFRLYEVLRTKLFRVGRDNHPIAISYGLSELKMTLNMIDTDKTEIKLELQKDHPNYDRIVKELADKEPFPDWYKFKIKVIDKAVSEINANTDMHIDYNTIRKGRGAKVVSVVFFIQRNDGDYHEILQVESNAQKASVQDVFDMMPEMELTRREANTLLKTANYRLYKIQQAYLLSKKQAHIRNFIAWMIAAINDNYEEPIEVMDGSVEQAKKVRTIQESYEKNKDLIALKAWEQAKTEEFFPEFSDYIADLLGCSIHEYEQTKPAKECYSDYVKWKLEQF